MREAEAQLAIKELQKTIHVLNLEYQEFLNNRQAFILASASANSIANSSNNNNNGNSSIPGGSSNDTGNTQQLEEELLKIKLREAEVISEMKSLNLKLMQLDTEVFIYYQNILLLFLIMIQKIKRMCCKTKTIKRNKLRTIK